MVTVADIARARSTPSGHGRGLLDNGPGGVGTDVSQSLADLAACMGVVPVQAADFAGVEAIFSVLAYAECARRGLAHVRWHGCDALLLTDLLNDNDRTWAAWRVPAASAVLLLTSPELFAQWLSGCEESMAALDLPGRRIDRVATTAPGTELDLARIGSQTNEIIRVVDSTLFDALKAGASDIHLECDPGGLSVKFRLDGVLVTVGHVEGGAEAAQIVSRIKVLSDLDIAEHRVPQDGRLSLTYRHRAIDVRVSIMPSVHGEDVVLRILDRQHLSDTIEGLTLDGLGFDPTTVERFKRLCAQPYGMVLVTGPTGSGKTTTLYAALIETRDPREKVITIEDPVEYHLDGVLQIPVNEKKGLTFARGLRSILRHDPDRILVGEIRDQETATIAVQSALTGHLVYTTVHANNAFDVLSRFTQLGTDSYDLAAALNGVLAQRLIRRACTHCAEPAAGPLADRDGPQASAVAPGRYVRAVGCIHCRGTGYRGRTAIGELLLLSPELKAALSRRLDPAELQRLAQHAGLVTLRDQAMRLAAQGLTTLDEVNRVTRST